MWANIKRNWSHIGSAIELIIVPLPFTINFPPEKSERSEANAKHFNCVKWKRFENGIRFTRAIPDTAKTRFKSIGCCIDSENIVHDATLAITISSDQIHVGSGAARSSQCTYNCENSRKVCINLMKWTTNNIPILMPSHMPTYETDTTKCWVGAVYRMSYSANTHTHTHCTTNDAPQLNRISNEAQRFPSEFWIRTLMQFKIATRSVRVKWAAMKVIESLWCWGPFNATHSKLRLPVERSNIILLFKSLNFSVWMRQKKTNIGLNSAYKIWNFTQFMRWKVFQIFLFFVFKFINNQHPSTVDGRWSSRLVWIFSTINSERLRKLDQSETKQFSVWENQ